jgi:hypothetical protein
MSEPHTIIRRRAGLQLIVRSLQHAPVKIIPFLAASAQNNVLKMVLKTTCKNELNPAVNILPRRYAVKVRDVLLVK